MALTPSHGPGRTVERVRKFIIKQIHLYVFFHPENSTVLTAVRIESLGATFVRPDLLSKSPFIDESSKLLEDIVEESFLGCPEFISTAVQWFSQQRDMIANPVMPEQQPRPEDLVSVLKAVRDFDCCAWASALPQESVVHDTDGLTKLARAYQLGCILYGRRILDAVERTQTGQDDTVSELIGIITALQHGDLLKCTLWPITVAGLECRSPQQRALLIQALDRLWQHTKCCNVFNASRILQDYWRRTNLDPIGTND